MTWGRVAAYRKQYFNLNLNPNPKPYVYPYLNPLHPYKRLQN